MVVSIMKYYKNVFVMKTLLKKVISFLVFLNDVGSEEKRISLHHVLVIFIWYDNILARDQ